MMQHRAPLAHRVSLVLVALVAACEPADTAGSEGSSSSGKSPGAPFSNNVCFTCTLSQCSVPGNACRLDSRCAAWLSCVGSTSTADDGVSARSDQLNRCGLPDTAVELANCIQAYSTFFYVGCESPCTPLPRDAGS